MPAAPKNDEHERGAEDVRQRASEKLEGFSPLFELAVAVSAVIGVFLLGFQIYYMRESNRLIQDSLRLTRESNDETRIASDDALKMNAHILNMMAEQNRLASTAIVTGAEQSEADRVQGAADAASSLKLAQRTLEVSQRAKIGIEFNDYKIEAGKPAVASILIKNSGPMPATEMIARISWTTTETPLPDNAPPVHSQGQESRAVLSSAIPHLMPIKVPAFSETLVQRIKSGEMLFYLWGKITYDDGFGKERHTAFCGVHTRDDDKWKICPNNNWAD